MILSIQLNNQTYQIDTAQPFDISIPLVFNGLQPSIYGVEKASAEAYEDEHFVGDTRRGGSCNFENLRLNPHCNGTHTECVGHITHKRISVNNCLKDAYLLANLISVTPEKASNSSENYAIELSNNDLLITCKALENFKSQISDFKSEALIVRTLPNDENKLSRTYLEEIPPFFSTEAMEFIVDSGIKHLLCDLPSIDRLFDDGKLSNHRSFWNVEQGEFEISAESFVNNTITELIYVPDEIKDGNYLLNLQIAPFQADASPSRPILFEIL
jgi:kynurenine formamidase